MSINKNPLLERRFILRVFHEFPEKLYIFFEFFSLFQIFIIKNRSFLRYEDDIEWCLLEIRERFIVWKTTPKVPIYTSFRLFSWENDPAPSISKPIWEGIRDESIWKKRFSFGENLFYFIFWESIFLCDHRELILSSTKTLCETREGNNTCISPSYIMMFTLSTDILKTCRIADGKNMTTLSATSLQNLLSVYSRLTSEESVSTETFSFLEFCEHSNRLNKWNDHPEGIYPLKSFGII